MQSILATQSPISWTIILCLLQLWFPCWTTAAQTTLDEFHELDVPILRFCEEWHSLGPFQVGTREAVWGADPLEAFGGFSKLRIDGNATYPSSLVPNATVKWQKITASTSSSSTKGSALLNIGYPSLEWTFHQLTYGWTSLQYQSWARGTIQNNSPRRERVNVIVAGVLEFSINDKHFFGGDFYGFSRGALIIDLEPGYNKVEIRLLGDVRLMGGASPPTIAAAISFERLRPDLHIIENSLIAPEIVNGHLTSLYLGVVIQNANDQPLVLHHCTLGHDTNGAHLVQNSTVVFAPGQSRHISLKLSSYNKHPKVVFVSLCYNVENNRMSPVQKLDFISILKERKPNEAWKYTFLHPSGIVSYATLKPPMKAGSNSTVLPLLLALHGAGVDVESDLARHSFDGVDNLENFVLIPSGGSSWSGDDWHTWGLSDTLAALDAVDICIENVQWNGSRLSTQNFVVTGHSNGGQGTWYLASHLPDRIIAAAPISGYTSIENYVPYTMWATSEQGSVLYVARNNFRNELFLPNLAHTPILQQHGMEDDNVPPYHSRLMSSMRSVLGYEHTYIELPHKGHWFDGVMSTQPLQHFYKRYLGPQNLNISIPASFHFIVSNSDDLGSRFGIVVDQLRSPDIMGRITVEVDHANGIWYARTHNIHRFHLDNSVLLSNIPKDIKVDEQSFETNVDNHSFCLSSLGTWRLQTHLWKGLSQRSGRQRGALDSILRTHGSFQIVSCAGCGIEISLQISRNMLQYYGADSNILNYGDYEKALSSQGNVITLSLGKQVPNPLLSTFPLSFGSDGIVLATSQLPYRSIKYSAGMGAVMLRPLPDERLELLVWGMDPLGLEQAARLIPTLTGVGQPDFVVLGIEAKWLGVAGTLALGFLDHNWQISGASYV